MGLALVWSRRRGVHFPPLERKGTRGPGPLLEREGRLGLAFPYWNGWEVFRLVPVSSGRGCVDLVPSRSKRKGVYLTPFWNGRELWIWPVVEIYKL